MGKRTTKRVKGLFGGEKLVHYRDGKKVGETRFKETVFGKRYQEHFDASGNKTGTTRRKDGWFSSKAVHYDSEGREKGYTKNRETFTGTRYQSHYNTGGDAVGKSTYEEGVFGGHWKSHEGEYYKADSESGEAGGPYVGGGGGGYSGEGGYEGSGIGRFLAVFAILAILVGVALTLMHRDGIRPFSPAASPANGLPAQPNVQSSASPEEPPLPTSTPEPPRQQEATTQPSENSQEQPEPPQPEVPTPSAQAPIPSDNYIRSLDARVVSMRFFESGLFQVAPEQRAYGARFARYQTRAINVELGLVHNPRPTDIRTRLEFRWYGPTGDILAIDEFAVAIKSGWARSLQYYAKGSPEAGHFLPGTYRVDVYDQGEKVTSGVFESFEWLAAEFLLDHRAGSLKNRSRILRSVRLFAAQRTSVS